MPGTLSIVIPTRNERDNVPRLVDALRAALDGLEYELVFVDDSTDGTDDVLAALARADRKITVHHRNGGRGLATAVLMGFGISRGEVLGVLDADLQHPPAVMAALARRMEETQADLVVASRYLPGAGRPGLSPWRRVVSQATRLLTWALLRASRRSSDPLSGCFVVRRSAVEGVLLQPIGFKILLEILVRGRCDRVAELPYVFVDRHAGRTKATVGQGLDLLRHLGSLTASSPEDARFWKFLLVGVSGVAANVVVFWTLTHVLRAHVLQAGIIAAALSTLTNFLLNNAYTWADRREASPSIFMRRLGKYYIATGAGNLVYLALLWGLTHVGLVPMLSNLIAIGVGGMLNYVAHNAWTWRHQGAGQTGAVGQR